MLMHSSTAQQNATGNHGIVSERLWFVGVLNMLLLLVMVFFAEVSSLQADGLFDFQMKLAKKGNAEAQFKVGDMYETGFGVKTNMKEAEVWTSKAAKQGHETAGFKLLYWDMKKNGMKGGNRAKYNALMKKAEAGNGQAMFYVGKMHAHGVGVKKNYDKALDWLNKATFIGIQEAEREAVAVREEKQRSLANARRVAEKRKAAAAAAAATAAATKARKDSQNRQAAKAAQHKRNKNAAEATQAANAAAAAEADRRAQQDRLRAQQEAAAAKERKRQSLLKQRAERDKERKAEFESDPCSGKSARFLSTCK